jgi:hypothetical protein
VYNFKEGILVHSSQRSIYRIAPCSFRRMQGRNPAAFPAALRHSKQFILPWFARPRASQMNERYLPAQNPHPQGENVLCPIQVPIIWPTSCDARLLALCAASLY